jgi:hypothetical protein
MRDHYRRWASRQGLLLPSSLFLAAVIFGIDSQIPLGVAVGVLYVIPVLLVVPLENRKFCLWVASACTVLIIMKLVFWPMGEAIPWMVFANRGLSLFVVWITLPLMLDALRAKRRLHEMESLLTVCAWTKQVKFEGRWMPFDQYLAKHLGFKITHVITEEAANKILQGLKIEVKET